MSKKITDEQLKSLQEKIGAIQNIESQIGRLETQKHKFLHQVGIVEQELSEMQKQLEEQYGKVSINISNGEYEDMPQEDEVVGPEVLKQE